MSSSEPLPPGAEPDDKEYMDEFLDECIKDFKLSDTLQMNNGDDDGNDSDASQKTVDFFTSYEKSKQIKREIRSRSTSPMTSSYHPRIKPPVEDVKPDRRKLDERIERQRSRRSRSTSPNQSRRTWSQGHSSRDHHQRSRERSHDSRDKSRRRSPEREDRKPNIHSRSSAGGRWSGSLSPIRRPQHIGLRRRSRSRSRSRSRERRDRQRVSPKRRRIDTRDRSRSLSPVRTAPRPRNDFLEEMMKKGVVSRDQATNALINVDIARAPIAPSLVNPAAVQIPMLGLNPMATPSLVAYNPVVHQTYAFNPQPAYMVPQPREFDQGRAQRALIEQEVQMEMQVQQRQEVLPKPSTKTVTAPKMSRSVAAFLENNDGAGSSARMSLSDFLMTKTRGLPVAARSTATSSSRKEKVLTRCIASANALERFERCLQNAQFLQVPLAEPPEFVKISGRSPLIVNRHNVLFRTTSVSHNVDFSQPFKNISYKIGTIIKTVGMDPSEISRSIQDREEEDRRIVENRRLVKAERASNETMRNDIGVQTDETKCERCMLQDLKTYRSTASQKSTATVDSCCQTSDMLAVQTSVSNLTPAQLRIIEQLLQLMESDTTTEQLMRFVAGSFGRNNQNNWRQMLDDSQQSYQNGDGNNGYDNDGDYGMVNRPGPGPPAGFREAPIPSTHRLNQGMRNSTSSSNLHSMLNHIQNNGRREAQQMHRRNNSFPSNRYY